MTAEEFKGKYFQATGIEIDSEVATELLKNQDSPWFNKILKMAEPTKWADLTAVYNVQINPTEHEGMK